MIKNLLAALCVVILNASPLLAEEPKILTDDKDVVNWPVFVEESSKYIHSEKDVDNSTKQEEPKNTTKTIDK